MSNSNPNSAKKPNSAKEKGSGPNLVNVSAAFGFRATKGKTIDFKVLLKCTGETFNVFKFPVNMQVKDLKSLLEFVCGIPFNLQRLSYLDDGELVNSKDLQYYDLIDGALINMDIWTIYVGLVQAAVRGDFQEALNQGVSTRVEWKSPTHDYMYALHKTKYIIERGGIALFIASHRGNIALVRGLISHGANINYQSSFGRTPIMVSVVANKTEIIEFLLSNNSDIDISDVNGDSPLTISKKFNNKLGTHKLAQFKWKKRTEDEIKAKKSSTKIEEVNVFPETRLPHQIFDSSKKTWIKGKFGAVYMVHLVPDNEFSGTKLSAPRSVGKEVLKKHLMSRSMGDLKPKIPNALSEEESDDKFEPIALGLSYEKWLEQKKEAKKKQDKRKKKEIEQQAVEKKDPNSKDSKLLFNVAEENWMKDYVQSANSLNKPEKENSEINPNFVLNRQNRQSIHSGSLGSRFKGSDMFNIYKGMSYDEWTKIRDKFLENHNMI